MPFFANITHENVFCQHSNAIYFLFLYSAFGKQHFGINLAKKGRATNNKHQKWILEQDIISDFSMRLRFIKTMALAFSFIQESKIFIIPYNKTLVRHSTRSCHQTRPYTIFSIRPCLLFHGILTHFKA